jgi:hypothetical protein
MRPVLTSMISTRCLSVLAPTATAASGVRGSPTYPNCAESDRYSSDDPSVLSCRASGSIEGVTAPVSQILARRAGSTL